MSAARASCAGDQGTGIQGAGVPHGPSGGRFSNGPEWERAGASLSPGEEGTKPVGTQSDEAPKLAQDRRTVLTQTRGEGSRRQERRSGQPPPGPLPGPLVPWDRDNAQVSGKSHDP